MASSFSEPRRRVAVTTTGVVSPLGLGLVETLAALRAGRDGVSPMTRFDVGRSRAKTAGQISAFWQCKEQGPRRWRTGRVEAGVRASRPAIEERHDGGTPSLLGGAVRHERQLHPASLMLRAATREACAGDPGFQPESMIIGTTSGGMSFGEAFYRGQLAAGRPRERAAWLANYSPQKPVLDAQTACGFSVPVQIIANACASGSNAIGHAWKLISTGQKTRVLCGGYDAIAEMVFAGFDSLQASTPEKIRPFDKDRSGLVLGEGAGVLALEEWESARRRRAPIVAELTGYGISTDNFHLTQPHPSGIGPRLAMERALAAASRRPEEVGYVNAHGTATQFNDATEGAAIHQLFGERTPVSSTKSMMGHALGAAGAIEAVFCILALQHRFLPPNINFTEIDPAWRLDIVANEAREADVRCVVSNSFGFGGTNASIVLERAEP